jgi:hypothetical protein
LLCCILVVSTARRQDPSLNKLLPSGFRNRFLLELSFSEPLAFRFDLVYFIDFCLLDCFLGGLLSCDLGSRRFLLLPNALLFVPLPLLFCFQLRFLCRLLR